MCVNNETENNVSKNIIRHTEDRYNWKAYTYNGVVASNVGPVCSNNNVHIATLLIIIVFIRFKKLAIIAQEW